MFLRIPTNAKSNELLSINLLDNHQIIKMISYLVTQINNNNKLEKFKQYINTQIVINQKDIQVISKNDYEPLDFHDWLETSRLDAKKSYNHPRLGGLYWSYENQCWQNLIVTYSYKSGQVSPEQFTVKLENVCFTLLHWETDPLFLESNLPSLNRLDWENILFAIRHDDFNELSEQLKKSNNGFMPTNYQMEQIRIERQKRVLENALPFSDKIKLVTI